MAFDTPHWTDSAESPAFSTTIDADENTLVVCGKAGAMLRDIGVPSDRITKLYTDVMNAGSREEALSHIERWFPLDRGRE